DEPIINHARGRRGLAAALRVPRLPRRGACAFRAARSPAWRAPGAAHGAWILPGAPRLVGALPVNYR
ncbi:MAG: hypothetical protein EB833_00430, partial [Thaumarchaeota archaeon S13]